VFSKYVSLMLLWLLILSIVVAQPVFSKPTIPTPRLDRDFAIIASGLAFRINDTSIVKVASLSITGKFDAVGKGARMAKLSDLSGYITIDGESHDIIAGSGMYNLWTGKIIITAKIDSQPGEKGRTLILYGQVSSGYAEPGGPVVFKDPQSKLAAAYFLDLNGDLQLAVELPPR
jgi:hypothetical protein